MKQTLYIVGNSVLKEDSLPIRLMPYLQKQFPEISFIHFDPTEDVIEDTQAAITIMDTVIGIDTVTLFESLDDFTRSPRSSVHDYDLYLDLMLKKKLKKISGVTIIGLPKNRPYQMVLKEVIRILSHL